MQQRWATLLLFALQVQSALCQEDAPAAPDGEMTKLQMQKLHKLMDADGNGRMSLDEMLAFATRTSDDMQTKSIGSVMQETDKSGDGKMSLEEHLVGFESESDADEETKKEMARLREVETAKFAAADANHDGFLDDAELPAIFFPDVHEGVLSIVTEDTLKQKDADGNGVLSFKEFSLSSDMTPEEESHRSGQMEYDRDMFARLDKDGDSSLSHEELKAYSTNLFHMRKPVPRAGQVHAPVRRCHRRQARHGGVHRPARVRMRAGGGQRPGRRGVQLVASLFAALDKDGDEHLSAEELERSHEHSDQDGVHYLQAWAGHHEL